MDNTANVIPEDFVSADELSDCTFATRLQIQSPPVLYSLCYPSVTITSTITIALYNSAINNRIVVIIEIVNFSHSI